MNNNQIIKFKNKEFLFRKINIKDKDNVVKLFKACEDFFILTEGKVPDEYDSFFYDLPPGKNIKDKFLYGIYENETLIAVIDIVVDYPEKDEWIIGLFLLHPKLRGIGLGREIHNVIKRLAIDNNAKKLRIGVIENNINGLKFWSKIGYETIKITEPRKFGLKESKVIVMNYYLN